jgi:alanine or glycine:cation symporter, AGCS family
MLPIIQNINSILWGYFLIFFLAGTGIFLTIRLRFVQVHYLKKAFKKTFSKSSFHEEKGQKGMTPFQALSTAVAAQIGTGNLAGAATAIMSGGPGAIFWMWVCAFFGMSTCFSEAVLAQKYKKEIDGEISGGPAYYIKNGLNSPILAAFFSISLIIALGFIGVMVQSNSISTSFNSAYNISPILIGVIIAILAGTILIGGIKRIGHFAEKVVPLMAILYIIGSIAIVAMHYQNILPALHMIFVGAFNPQAVAGGIFGATIRQAVRYGVARGLFSNEAGMGSTPHAHAVAKVAHPVDQGLVSIVGVFVDTFIVLTLTALVILTTGVLGNGKTGIELTQSAFNQGFGAWGSPFIAICLLFFAFTTIIGWAFFGEANIKYLFVRRFGKSPLYIYRILVLAFVILGSLVKVDFIWELADTFNGLMVIPNLIALIILSTVVSKELKSYKEKTK